MAWVYNFIQLKSPCMLSIVPMKYTNPISLNNND